MNNSTTKQCSKCGVEYPSTLEFFRKARLSLRRECRKCERDAHKAWADKNRDNPERKEKKRLSDKRYYQENAEKIKRYVAEWQKNNRDKVNASQRARYWLDPEVSRAKSRAHQKRYSKRHPDRVRISFKTYYYNNIEEQRKRASDWAKNNPTKERAAQQRRRANKRGLPNTLTNDQWEAALNYWDQKCAVCGASANMWVVLSPDHWHPISKGGGTTADNIVPLCHARKGIPNGEPCCNNSKKDKLPADWLTQRFGKRKARVILAKIEAYFAAIGGNQ